MDKDLVILELNKRWKWQIPFGWIPVSSSELIENTEIYHADYFDLFKEEIINAISCIYCLNELYELVEGGQVSIQPFSECTFFTMDWSVCTPTKISGGGLLGGVCRKRS